MTPDLEVVDVPAHESFKAWGHGYPHSTVRWHFHPEYEIHLITETSGEYVVGDFAGRFAPGNLVFTGPNLPHNWVSEVPQGSRVERRNLILQFSSSFLMERVLSVPEFCYLEKLVLDSRRGVLFSESVAAAARPIMEELLTARNGRRIILFLSLLDLIVADKGRSLLASQRFSTDPSSYMASTINQVLSYIDQNLATDLREADVADLAGQSASMFSRSFRKNSGMTFVQYVNRQRIQRACELLINTNVSVTDVRFRVGYKNLSSFDRQFQVQKGISPRRFRRAHQGQNLYAAAMDLAAPAPVAQRKPHRARP